MPRSSPAACSDATMPLATLPPLSTTLAKWSTCKHARNPPYPPTPSIYRNICLHVCMYAYQYAAWEVARCEARCNVLGRAYT